MATKTKAPADIDVSESALELHKEAKGIDFVPESWADIAAAFEGEVVVFEGSPYKVVDKKVLIGVPFMIADVRFYHSDKYDSEAVAVALLTEDGQRYVINDGSSGVFQQMKHMLATSKRKAGIMCPNGLRASDYKIEDAFGKEIEATTYYVA